VKLSGVETIDLGEQGDHSGNMNSLNSNHELDSLRLDQEDDSNGTVIDDANTLPSSCVFPDEVVEESSESNRENPSGSESQDSQLMDSRTDGDADIAISINDVDESIRGAREPVITNSLFSKAALYRIAKPIIDELQKLILNLMHAGYKGAIHPESKWGPDRFKQFINDIVARIETVSGVSNIEPTSNLDTGMIDSAVNYISSLQTSGINFTANEYVRVHILESLIVSKTSNRTLATRLGINRKSLPDIIEKRKNSMK
jgi:hypothetical protein